MVERHCPRCDSEVELDGGRIVAMIMNGKRYVEERTCNSTTDDFAWCFACSECGKSFPRNELQKAHNHGEINYCPNCGCKVVNQ